MFQGQTSDSQTVLFTTSTTQYNSEVVQSTNAGAPPPPSTSPTAALSCVAKCGTYMNFVCYLRYKCWKLLGSFLGLLAGLAAIGGAS